MRLQKCYGVCECRERSCPSRHTAVGPATSVQRTWRNERPYRLPRHNSSFYYTCRSSGIIQNRFPAFARQRELFVWRRRTASVRVKGSLRSLRRRPLEDSPGLIQVRCLLLVRRTSALPQPKHNGLRVFSRCSLQYGLSPAGQGSLPRSLLDYSKSPVFVYGCSS